MIDVHHIEQISQDCSLTEFVGTTVLDTIGLVIPGIDPSLLEKMNLKKPYKSLGLISSRTGAAGQINAADEAVKSTNTEIVSIELPRDTKGWGVPVRKHTPRPVITYFSTVSTRWNA